MLHISWGSQEEGVQRPPAVPDVLYVKLNAYRGPQYFEDRVRIVDGQEISDKVRAINRRLIDLRGVVPLAPIEAQDDRGPAAHALGTQGANCFRRQLPFKLAFGVTHHQSQGGTLDKVVSDIGDKENNDGRSFTALSMCRELGNMILEDFTEGCLTKIGDSPH